MKVMKYAKGYLQAISAAGLMMAPVGCGDDPSSYSNETLTVENPVSSKSKDDKRIGELSLSETDSSEFGVFGGVGPIVPWTYPFFDYWDAFLPAVVPVNPGLSLIEPIHPFYAYRVWNPFWSDDDEGRAFFNDDDDNRRRDDD